MSFVRPGTLTLEPKLALHVTIAMWRTAPNYQWWQHSASV